MVLAPLLAGCGSHIHNDDHSDDHTHGMTGRDANGIICERKGGEWSNNVCSGINADVCAVMKGEYHDQKCVIGQ